MTSILKGLYLAVHVVATVFLVLLLGLGSATVHMRDGSNNNPGAALSGILAFLLFVVTALPLAAAVATRWVSRWWLAAHLALGVAAVVFTGYALVFEEIGSADRG